MSALPDDQTDAEVLAKFSRILREEWLPTFCNDPKRGYGVEGFKPESAGVSVNDARDFMRAIDHSLFVDTGGGRYLPPRRGPCEQIFWQGLERKSPRPVTLWHEPIITAAALARLHLEYGWPKGLLGTQSRKKWEFDLLGAEPNSEDGKGDYRAERLVGEIKKSESEVLGMLRYMRDIFPRIDGNVPSPIAERDRNSHRKCLGLLRLRPKFFWAVGPNRFGRFFSVSYIDEASFELHERDISSIRFDVGMCRQSG